MHIVSWERYVAGQTLISLVPRPMPGYEARLSYTTNNIQYVMAYVRLIELSTGKHSCLNLHKQLRLPVS